MQTDRLPSLTALRAFEAAARLGSAKAAALALSVTPAAISHQIRQLEDELDVALFERLPRRLVVTPTGRALQAELAQAFARMADAVRQARGPQGRRSLTLSVTPAVAAHWLLPHMAALQSDHPEIDLRLKVTHAVDPLDGRGADLAIRYGSGVWHGLHADKLMDTAFVPACSPRLPLREPADLLAQTLLHFQPPVEHTLSDPASWPEWAQLAGLSALNVRAGLVFSDETHAMAAAVAGRGVALVSQALAASTLASGALVQPFGPALPGLPFFLVVPTARLDEPAMAAVRAWVLGIATSAAPPPV